MSQNLSEDVNKQAEDLLKSLAVGLSGDIADMVRIAAELEDDVRENGITEEDRELAERINGILPIFGIEKIEINKLK